MQEIMHVQMKKKKALSLIFFRLQEKETKKYYPESSLVAFVGLIIYSN
jgi:hypothetical protein